MEQHPVFPRIRLHSDVELAEAIGAEIVERQTIHEWPLSCVQRLVVAGGRRLVYKAQLPPSIEVEFYDRAASSLLPSHRFLAKVDECQIMTLDWIDAPLLREATRSEGEWAEHGRRLVAQIGDIRGNPPVYLDVGSVDAWSSVVDATLRTLEGLIGAGRFRAIRRESMNALRRWAESQTVRECIGNAPRLIHGDLNAGQVFLEQDGYRVIDWQRPVIGPPDVDLVSLLVAERIDPRAYVAREAAGVFWFLFLRWAVVAQAELFPDFAGPLFGRWAAVAARQILDRSAPMPSEGIPPA